MRKRVINSDGQQKIDSEHKWLDIEKIAIVEVTSEEEAYPIESALLSKDSEWRASSQGKQIVRLVFDAPQTLQWIRLKFEELNIERTQEYFLSWSQDCGQSYQEILRQQWNFSPEGSTSQVEDYQVELYGVTNLELNINPHISNGSAFASLKEFRLA
jgi:hypothetical protein